MRRRKTIKVDVSLLEGWATVINCIADRIMPLERGDITASINIFGVMPTDALRKVASGISTTIAHGLEQKKQVDGTIKFAKDGQLEDGQHRLKGIIKKGKVNL